MGQNDCQCVYKPENVGLRNIDVRRRPSTLGTLISRKRKHAFEPKHFLGKNPPVELCPKGTSQNFISHILLGECASFINF